MYFRSAILLAMLHGLSGCDTDLYSDLSAKEADLMVATLAASGVSATRVDTGSGKYALQVETGQAVNAQRILGSQGFPRDRFQTLADVFPGGGLVRSPMEEKARYEYALSQELSRSISGLRDVKSARVHVSLGTSDIRGRAVTETSASVVIQSAGAGRALELSRQTRLIVSGGVSGIKLDNIQVVVWLDNPSEGDATSRPVDQTSAITTGAAVAKLQCRAPGPCSGL